ncbi:MAG: iron-sulfur cluster assembly protein, partial [Streptosporangiaceae bacterium]
MSPAESTPPPSTEQVTAALARVDDPEIRRPITDLGMVKSVDIAPDGKVRV